MIQELITCEIKNVIIAMASDYKGFYVYIRPVDKDIEEFFKDCCKASIKKLEEIQQTKRGKFRYWTSPSLAPMRYNAANTRFFKLVKQANLPQISFQ